MARQLVEHMVEEADARRNVGSALAVDMDRHRNLGFLGLAAHFSGTGRHNSVLAVLTRSTGLKTRAFYQHDPAIASCHSRRYRPRRRAVCNHPPHAYIWQSKSLVPRQSPFKGIARIGARNVE